MNPQMLDIGSIRIDGDTQPRLAIDQEVVAEYAEALERGAEFPAVKVVSDGAAHWLVDGFHRYYAHRKLGRSQIKAEVTTGLLEEAQWLSLTANQGHGLRRTNQDKAKAVIKALKMRPQLSNAVLAEHIGVTHPMVAKYRAAIEARRQGAASRATIESGDETRAGCNGYNLPGHKGKDGKRYPAHRRSKPAISGHALTPVRPVNTPTEEKLHVGMSKDPAMGARALCEFFDAAYIQQLVEELQRLLAGTAGTPPSLANVS